MNSETPGNRTDIMTSYFLSPFSNSERQWDQVTDGSVVDIARKTDTNCYYAFHSLAPRLPIAETRWRRPPRINSWKWLAGSDFPSAPSVKDRGPQRVPTSPARSSPLHFLAQSVSPGVEHVSSGDALVHSRNALGMNAISYTDLLNRAMHLLTHSRAHLRVSTASQLVAYAFVDAGNALARSYVTPILTHSYTHLRVSTASRLVA